MEWFIKNLEKYSSGICNAFVDGCNVIGSPRQFFSRIKDSKKSNVRIFRYVITLTVCLLIIQTPLMINAGVNTSNPIFYIIEAMITLVLFFLFALYFHMFLFFRNKNASYLSTYKVVTYSSIWFLIMYIPLFLPEMVRFKAMSESADVINLGYYSNFRETLDSSQLLTSMNSVAFIFVIFFAVWVAIGLKVVHGLSNITATLLSIIGLIPMFITLQYAQNAITHQLIRIF